MIMIMISWPEEKSKPTTDLLLLHGDQQPDTAPPGCSEAILIRNTSKAQAGCYVYRFLQEVRIKKHV